MSVRFDSADAPKLAATMGRSGTIILVLIAALIGFAGFFGYLVVQREDEIIAREDLILQEEIIIRQRIDGLERAVSASNSEAEERFQKWLDAQTRQHSALVAWLRAGCYASANGSAESRAYCDRVGGSD